MALRLAFAIIGILLFIYRYARLGRLTKEEQDLTLKRGCKPPTPSCSTWPLNIDLVFNAFYAETKQQVMHYFVGIVEKSGSTFELNVLGARCVDTVDPVNIEAILSKNFQDFGLGERRATFYPLLGSGIFTQDGAAWKHSRDLLRPQFSKKRLENFEQIQSQVENLIARIPSDRDVDLQALFFRFTLDTTTHMLLGKSLNSLCDTDKAHDEALFAESFRIAQDYLARRSRLVKFYWLLSPPKFRRACSTVHKWVDETIQASLTTHSMTEKSLDSGEDDSFLSYLTKETRDPRVLRDQLINLLLAGRDTTACCLSWCLLLLAQHQDKQQKLRHEIDAVLGTGESRKQVPESKDLKKMTYLSLVLKEVLRLYPPVPINSREVIRTTTLPKGGGEDGEAPVLLRKGEYVGYSVYAMHRRKDLYGPDADEFRPERWELAEDEEFNLRHIGWGYLPFNGGPRACLGQEFALQEASYAIVRILQEFQSITNPSQSQSSTSATGEEKQALSLVLASAEGCVLRLGKTGS